MSCRLPIALLAAAGLTPAAVGLTGSASTAAAHSRAPARLLVYAQEWSLWPSRQTVPAGRVLVALSNRGQDAHDIRIQRLRGGHTTGRAQGVGVTQSGLIRDGSWRLGPGRYELFCSLPGHRGLGMHATLVVR